jgi:hypothetical protein
MAATVARGGLKEGLGLPKVLRFWIVDINSSVPGTVGLEK